MMLIPHESWNSNSFWLITFIVSTIILNDPSSYDTSVPSITSFIFDSLALVFLRLAFSAFTSRIFLLVSL